MSPYKDIRMAVDAVLMLRPDFPNLHLTVVGAGSLPKDLPSGSFLTVRNEWVPQDKLETVLRGFDILVLPYVEASQSGILTYAMSLGIPSVVTPVGGLVEQAEAGGHALIADDVTTEGIAAAMRRLLTESSLYEALRLAGLRAAATDFSWSKLAYLSLDVAAKLVLERSRARP
jgi:glycosyltransferase involved in cell wall biosynthesis